MIGPIFGRTVCDKVSNHVPKAHPITFELLDSVKFNVGIALFLDDPSQPSTLVGTERMFGFIHREFG